MKKCVRKEIVFMLTIMLAFAVVSFTNAKSVFAKEKNKKEATFSVTSKNLFDEGETFEISLNYSGKDIKNITWYTQNDKVATVNAGNNSLKATITSQRKGTTHVKCKITLNDGTVLRPACKVVVSETDVEITNEKKDNEGKHVMTVGDSYTFNAKIKPEDSYKSIYWYIDKEEYATVDSKGTVTAKKEGTVTLTAIAAYTKAGTWISEAKDSVTIKIIKKDNNTFSPQAKLLSLVRNYNRITATFDRGIQTPGLLLVNNRTECIEGVVDSTNNTIVHYNLSSTASKLYGWQKVTIGYWEGFWVSPDDKSSDKFTEMYIDLNVTNYIPLPPPISISQSVNNNNMITVQFNNKVDEYTAENIKNYSIEGVTIFSAELISSSASSSTVQLTLEQSSIKETKAYLVTMYGIKGYDNSYDVMDPYQTYVYMEENLPPVLYNHYYSYPSSITLIFDDTISGTPSFKVMYNNTDIASYAVIVDKTVIITLNKLPNQYSELTVIPTKDNVIKDSNGNLTSSSLNFKVTVTY